MVPLGQVGAGVLFALEFLFIALRPALQHVRFAVGAALVMTGEVVMVNLRGA